MGYVLLKKHDFERFFLGVKFQPCVYIFLAHFFDLVYCIFQSPTAMCVIN